jgi:hypothetical protein
MTYVGLYLVLFPFFCFDNFNTSYSYLGTVPLLLIFSVALTVIKFKEGVWAPYVMYVILSKHVSP